MTKYVVGSTNLRVQRNSDGSGELIPAGIVPQVSQLFSISKVAGASTVVMGFKPYLAASCDTLTWGGQEHIFNVNHGGALQGSEIFSNAYPGFSVSQSLIPTEQGSENDSTNLHLTTSNSLFVGASVAGDRAYVITDAAEWLTPDGVTNPLSWSNRKLSGFVRSRDITIGVEQAQAIRVYQTITFPSRSDIQGSGMRWRIVSPCNIFSPSATFTRMFNLDVTNGTTTTEVFPVLNGAQLLHATNPYISCTADGASHAIGVYAPVSEWDATNSRYVGALITNNIECTYYDIHDYGAGGIAAGPRVNNSWICFGTLSDVASTMRALYLLFP